MFWFGLSWALVGIAPLFLPALNWHSYYALFASLGAWIGISAPVCRSPRAAMALALVLAVLRAGRSTTVIHDWGEESYVRRAGVVLTELRTDLLAEFPHPAPNTRFYFHDVPSESGFLIGDGPSLRVWYGDPSIRGGFYRDFRVREHASLAGRDRFLHFAPGRGWIEVVTGPEDVARAHLRDPHWAEEQLRLALTLTRGGDWNTASHQYAKLAEAFPDSATYPYMAGLTLLGAGDSLGARPWLLRAGALPSADEEMRSTARGLKQR